jgi:hypothetical protein
VIALTLPAVRPRGGRSRSDGPRRRDSVPIVEVRRRAHFLRKVDSIGAKTARNTAALPAEVTPGVVALAAAAITGPFSDAGRALNLRAQRGQGIGGVPVQVGSQCRWGPVESPDVAGERDDAASAGSRP